jgi:hypothetical protein
MPGRRFSPGHAKQRDRRRRPQSLPHVQNPSVFAALKWIPACAGMTHPFPFAARLRRSLTDG